MNILRTETSLNITARDLLVAPRNVHQVRSDPLPSR